VERRLHVVAESSGVALDEVRLAVEFYAAVPDEIDARIAADERAQLALRQAIDRRERLLSSWDGCSTRPGL
jgi:hypothetical protein